MHPEIENKIEDLRRTLCEYAPKDAVAFRLSLNYEETSVEMDICIAEQLMKSWILVQNLGGDFIRVHPAKKETRKYNRRPKYSEDFNK